MSRTNFHRIIPVLGVMVISACGAPRVASEDGGSMVLEADASTPVSDFDASTERMPDPSIVPDGGSDHGDPPIVWPEGFTPAKTWSPDTKLCDVSVEYLEAGNDPVFIPCQVEVDHFAPADPPTPASELKVVSWNIEFGKKSAELLATLQTHEELKNADVLMFQEAARFDAESVPARNHFAREAAQALKMNYAYFTHWDLRLIPENGGEHGVAILTRFPIGNVRALRHASDHNWYKDKKRLGGRGTLGLEIVVNNHRIRLYNSHFDTRDTFGRLRARQGLEVRQDASRTDAAPLQIAGGDYNTFLCNPAIANCTEPPAAEPVIKDFLAAGWEDLLQRNNGWTQIGSGVLKQRLDWLFGKGVTPVRHLLLQDIRTSDHIPVLTVIQAPAPR